MGRLRSVPYIGCGDANMALLSVGGGGEELAKLSVDDFMEAKLRDLRRLRRKVLATADGDEQIRSTKAILDYLDSAHWQSEVTTELFDNLVDRITLVSGDELKFRLLNGLELTERLV